jgi:adenylosuccinate synthase
MRSGQVVIGANFGDEGKGLLTDYFASEQPGRTLVVRFNGGAQAGHTVLVPDGRRHVFSHFGSGSFAGAATYLSKFFIVNPMLFAKELNDLHNLNVYPAVSIDGDCFVTTPFDIFINQMKELQRGRTRHGSCGAGINETVTRCLRPATSSTSPWSPTSPRPSTLVTKAADFLDLDTFREKLKSLGKTWLWARMRELNLDAEAARGFISIIDDIVTQYIEDVRTILRAATIVPSSADLLSGAGLASDAISLTEFLGCADARIIFEGAQGLLLDEDRIDQWPHVTRSKAGLANVLHLAPKFNLDKLDVTYVTRTYVTRHGAGPLDGECDWWFPDNTNINNQFQGSLRFAPLNCRELNRSIELDLGSARRSTAITIDADIAITCADQHAPPGVEELFLPVRYVSHGPARTDVCSQQSQCLLI